MRRIVLVFALTALLITVVVTGSGLAQPRPDVGCEGLYNAFVAQEEQEPAEQANFKAEQPPTGPSQGDENSATEKVGNAHLCKLGGPPPDPGQSGR